MRREIVGYGTVAAAVGAGLAIYFAGASGVASRGTWFVLGETIGITAAVLLCFAAILAVRLRPLEWLFGDMTKVYVAHGVVGLAMFALVTAHPLLYVFGTLPETRDAAGIVVPFRLVALDWVSWICIALAMVPTLFVRLRFDRWRWTHLFLGVAVILTGVSLVLTSRAFDTFQVPALRIYLGTLFVLALLAVIHVSFVRRLLEPKHEYRVVRAERHAEAGAVELHLEAVGRPLAFAAGQFAYFDVLDDRLHVKRDFESHPFSIASAPGQDELRVIVGVRGEHTQRLQEIADGDGAHALVHGAYGQLRVPFARAPKQLWIGGGIGITPFLSLAEQLDRDAAAGDPAARAADVVLVVSVQRAADAFFAPRLQACAARVPGLEVVLWSTEERGHPTAAQLAERVRDVDERAVLMSGPEAMLADLSHQLHDVGVPRARIRTEIAIGPPQRWRYASPALRVMRAVVAVELALFVGAVVASTIGRALT